MALASTMYGCDNLCLLNMYAMGHRSVTLCNGKTLRIPKNIGEDNNRGLSFPQKDAKGLAYICICPKNLIYDRPENCWSRSVSIAALSCISSHLYPSALMPHVDAHDGWWEGCDGV